MPATLTYQKTALNEPVLNGISNTEKLMSKSEITLLKEKLLEELDQFSELEEDWDELGANTIDKKCIIFAKLFVNILFDKLPVMDVSWEEPTLFPSFDGGLKFHWFTQKGQTLLIFQPNSQEIVVHKKEMDQPSQQFYTSLQETIKYALTAMYGG